MTRAQRYALARLVFNAEKDQRRMHYVGGKGWGRTSWEKKMDALVTLGYAVRFEEYNNEYLPTTAGRAQLAELIKKAAASAQRARDALKHVTSSTTIERLKERLHRFEYEVLCLQKGMF